MGGETEVKDLIANRDRKLLQGCTLVTTKRKTTKSEQQQLVYIHT